MAWSKSPSMTLRWWSPTNWASCHTILGWVVTSRRWHWFCAPASSAIKTGYKKATSRFLQGWSQNPNRVISEDWRQPSSPFWTPPTPSLKFLQVKKKDRIGLMELLLFTIWGCSRDADLRVTPLCKIMHCHLRSWYHALVPLLCPLVSKCEFRFPWRSTTKVLMVEAGQAVSCFHNQYWYREQRHVFEGNESKLKPCQFKWLRTAFHSFMEKHYEGLDGRSRTPASTIKTGYHREPRHVIEGTESKPEPCQFKWLRTAFHSFMEKHYKGLDGGSRTSCVLLPQSILVPRATPCVWRERVEAQTVSIQMIEDGLPFVFHGEALRRSWWWKQDKLCPASTINTGTESNAMCLKGTSRSSNRVNSNDWGRPSIRLWRSTTKVLMVEAGQAVSCFHNQYWYREQRHVFEGNESKLKPCQFKWLRTAFHSFSMEKHYEGLDGRSRTPASTIKTGYHREPRHVIEGTESKPKPCQFKWLRTAFHSFMEKHYKGLDGGSRTPVFGINTGYHREQRHVIEGTESKPKPCQFKWLRTAFHSVSMEKHYKGLDGGSRTTASTINTGYQRATSCCLKGSSRSSNRVNSNDWGRPSIRFPWRSTTKVLMVEAGPLLPPSKLGTREQRHVFEGIESKFKLRHREFATNGSCVCLFHLWFQLQAHWLENLVSRRMIMYEWDKHQTVVALFHAAGGCRCPC